MATECNNKEVLFETMKMSFSCSSPGKARWRRLSPQHCGYCVPCIIRRAAMHKKHLEMMEQYIRRHPFTKCKSKNSEGIEFSCVLFQYAIDKIKKKIENVLLLYIHKPGPLPQDDEYLKELAETYIRGLLEVDIFIQDSLEQEEKDNDL